MPTPPTAASFKLLYDGECPLCLREVAWLRRRDRAGRLALLDITAPGFEPADFGATREELMGVIHGVLPDGRVVRRLEALREAWRTVGLGWLIAPTAWPGLRWVFDRMYAAFARRRMRLGRLLGRPCPAHVGCGPGAGGAPRRDRACRA